MEKMVNEFEAAKYLDLSVNTLRVWRSAKTRDLKYYKLGKAVRYRISDIDAFIDAGVQVR